MQLFIKCSWKLSKLQAGQLAFPHYCLFCWRTYSWSGEGRGGLWHPSCSLDLKWKTMLMIAVKFWPSMPKQGGCLCFHNTQESNKLILNDLEEKLSGIYQVRSGETKQFWKKVMANPFLLPRKVNGYVHEITKGQVSLEGHNHRSLCK